MTEHAAVRHGRKILAVCVAGMLLAMAMHWSWNSFAVEVLGFNAMRFKHAVALEFLLFSLAACAWLARRIAGARPA